MRIAPSWIACTPSSSKGSIGRSLFCVMRHGIWLITAGLSRRALPARPPALLRRGISSDIRTLPLALTEQYPSPKVGAKSDG